jgi:Domain of unknown function (DUF4760)
VSLDAWNTVISLAGLVLSTVGIGFVAIQVTLARRQALDGQQAELREYERLKRQATLDFISGGRSLYLKLRSMLPDDWDEEAVARYVAEAYASNDVHRIASLAAYMGHYESLAVGVASEIYDLHAVEALIGTRVIRIAQTYQSFIQEARRRANGPSLYVELEWLAMKVAELRQSQGGYVLFADRSRGLVRSAAGGPSG